MEESERKYKLYKTNTSVTELVGHIIIVVYLKDLLGSFLHSRPHLVAETPQCVKLQDGVDALAGFQVLELCHHHFGHRVRDLYRAQKEHGSWRGKGEGKES